MMSAQAPAAPHNADKFSDQAALAKAVAAGDARATEYLVRTHSGPLLAAARRLLNNEEDARDALQEAFVSVFKNINSFSGQSSLSTWLHRIIINHALMKLRARKRKPEASIEDLLPSFREDGHRKVPGDDWSDSGEQLLQQKQASAFVRQAIQQLPEKYRQALLLRDIQQLSTRDSAQLLGVNENTVKLRLHRARQALRGLLAPRLGEFTQ